MNLRPSVFIFLSLLLLGLGRPVQAAIDAPVSPNAQPGVAQLLSFLESVNGRYVLSGQQEIAWDLNRQEEDFDYILKTTGKTPAVRGFDFLQYVYSPSVRANQNATERAIAWAKSGGIVTFCCHLFMDLNSTNGSPQFYVPAANHGVGTNFDIRQAVIAGTPENTEFLAKLDLIAAELKKLRDAGVVVLWRPFHECSGGWFWWGAQGAAPLKQAWRIMFDRFTGQHGLNNLIWVFNPTDTISTNLPAWYPGDDVVDVISIDVYPTAGTHPDFASSYKTMRDFKTGRKVVTMSENGAIPEIDQAFANGASWAYFCTWNGFENDLTQNSASFLNTVYNHPKVVTLDELPALYVADAWAITTQPQTQLLVSGSPLSLGVVARGPGSLAYQWLKDGAVLPGATAATYTVAHADATTAGTYTVRVSGTPGTLTSAPAIVSVAPTDDGKIVDLAVLATAGTNEQTLIIGFVMTGSSSAKPILFRGVGPTLDPSFLPDPNLRLNTTPAFTNDDWGTNPATTVDEFNALFARLGATPLKSASKDAALLVPLAGGAYTASVAGAGGSTGLVLAEIYDAAPGTGARLANISARGKVGGGSVLYAGFVIVDESRTVLVRAIGGQALKDQGVSSPLTNPVLKLYRGSTVIKTNDEWTTGETAISTLKATYSTLGAFGLPAASHDAALLLTLPPGVYSAHVESVDSSSGVGLVEIYEVR